MSGLEISAAEYTMDTIIVISGRIQFSKILLTAERRQEISTDSLIK